MTNLVSVRTVRKIASDPVGTAKKGVGRLMRFSKNMQSRFRGSPDGLPIPPDELLALVAGTDDVSWFLEYGRKGADSIKSVLERNGLQIGNFQSILDFGCGCGRVIRYFQPLANSKLHGCDYNPQLINWCKQNLTFAQFETSHLAPPLPYADGTFDLLYSLSVFTHLPEALQFDWMRELSRVLKVGGLAFITTHGEAYFDVMLPEEQTRFRSGQVVIRSEDVAGTNNFCTFHPPVYFRERLASAFGFEVVDFVAEGAKGNGRQDVFLLRKRSSMSEAN